MIDLEKLKPPHNSSLVLKAQYNNDDNWTEYFIVDKIKDECFEIAAFYKLDCYEYKEIHNPFNEKFHVNGWDVKGWMILD